MPQLVSPSRPRCPLHPEAKVWRDGFGGRVHLRQRFKCVLADGTKHVFSEPIPRQAARDVECDECERDLARHEGPRSVKDYFFTISQAASVLNRVGMGDSYRAAAQHARRLDHRLARKKPRYRDYSLSGSLAEDWVEVFAPVLWRTHAPQAWPSAGCLLLDETEFHSRYHSGHTHLWSVLAAYGYPADGSSPRVWLLRSYFQPSHAEWEHFLLQLPGRPARVVCDGAKAIEKAALRVWADNPPEIHSCEGHLKSRFLDKLPETERRGPGSIGQMLDDALASEAAWREFGDILFARWQSAEAGARQEGAGVEERQLAIALRGRVEWMGGPHGKSALITAQQNACEAVLGAAQGRDPWPRSVGPLEQVLNQQIRWRLEYRCRVLTNRRRTDRLLALMQLDVNHVANLRLYRRLIKEHLEASADGRAAKQRLITERLAYRRRKIGSGLRRPLTAEELEQVGL